MGVYKDACRGSKKRKKEEMYEFTSSCLLPPLPSAISKTIISTRITDIYVGDETNLGFPDFACTCVPLVGTSVAEGPVGLELALFLGDFAGCLVGDGFGQRESHPCCLGIESVAL